MTDPGGRQVPWRRSLPRPSEAPDRSGWELLDAGVSLAPVFTAYLDGPRQPAAGGWVTWRAGRLRVEIDYVHNRRRYLTYPGYYEERDGRKIVVQRAYRDRYEEQATGASVHWRLLEHGYVLLGLAYWNLASSPCVAGGEPVVRLPPRAHDPNELLYRVEFGEGEERRCAQEPARRKHVFLPQVGAGFDVPVGSRFFVRAQVRLLLCDVRMGVGFRF